MVVTKIIGVSLSLFITFTVACTFQCDDQANAVRQLANRLFPDTIIRSQIHLYVDPSLTDESHNDYFRIDNQPIGIAITGTNGVAAANGFHYYLKQFGKCHVSWSGDQLNISNPIPRVPDGGVVVQIQDKVRYYFNVCTFSYSTVWWDWNRWEREIDWMALNGINFPLAFTGQEYVWWKLFTEIGLKEDEIGRFFTGPAFLAWNRMGNIEDLYGPLSQPFLESQADLQKKILLRMRSLGMITIGPAFSGHVPREISRIFPGVKLTQLESWNNFNSTYSSVFIVNPDDPVFKKLGKRFIELYTAEYGTDHYYNVDTFNENTPPTNSTEYLAKIGKVIFDSMESADADAIWVMQGWLFLNKEFWGVEQAKAVITSVPHGRMIVLDLFSETMPQFDRLQGYFGQPFIWCMLHNFGGVQGLFGNMESINTNVYVTRKKYPNMIGVGLTPEGIETNDIMYELMMETIWKDEPINLDQWVGERSIRRYNGDFNQLSDAWKLLANSILKNASFANHGRYIISSRPSLGLKPLIFYDVEKVNGAFSLFKQAQVKYPFLKASPTFNYDFTDLARQVHQSAFGSYYLQMVQAYKAKNLNSFRKTSHLMISLLESLDKILEGNPHFRLDKWVEDSSAIAPKGEESYYRQMARNQVSLWGFHGEIVDYAVKQWSGLVSRYMNPRWSLFVTQLEQSLVKNQTFNETQFVKDVFSQVELPFVVNDVDDSDNLITTSSVSTKKRG